MAGWVGGLQDLIAAVGFKQIRLQGSFKCSDESKEQEAKEIENKKGTHLIRPVCVCVCVCVCVGGWVGGWVGVGMCVWGGGRGVLYK